MEPTVGLLDIVGRVSERQCLVDALQEAVEGRPGAVLVHGEAGVGKSALVRSVTVEARQAGVQVLWGSALRFGAADALLLPVTMALDRWLREAEAADRERVLGNVPGVGSLLPSLGDGSAGDTAVTRLVPVVDALIGRIVALGPTLLGVDDLRWADPASRDALGSLIAGFSSQCFALVTTHRDDDTRATEEFSTWVADMRRMPSVSLLRLDRLNREATRRQLTSLLGTPPARSLLDQVFERSQGNAYLTELLASEADASSDVLPANLPSALTEALLSAWHRLTPPGRDLTRFLSVAGRPTPMSTIRDVVVDLTGNDALVGSLREAVDAGIVVVDGQTAWFRHPLLADVLMNTFLPGEATPAHAAWARALSRTTAVGIDEVRRLSALALHREAASDMKGAFAASLAAAVLAEEHGSVGEAARNVVRSVALWDAGAPDPHDTAALLTLLERGIQLCRRAEQSPEAYAMITRARAVLDEHADPLRATRLLEDWTEQRWELGLIDEPPVEDLVRAVDLARSSPDSRELAGSLAMLSNVLRWAGRPDEAMERAEEAVTVAGRSGSPTALAVALGSRGSAQRDLRLADADCAQALNSARESGDDLFIGYAYGARSNLLERTGRISELVLLLRQAVDHAVEHGRGAAESAALAAALLEVGDLLTAAQVLREGLSRPGRGRASASLRLSAATLAARQGDPAAANLHRQRAYELMPTRERHNGAFAVTALAEVLLSDGHPEAALRLVLEGMPAATHPPAWADEILLWGVRAAADLAQAGNDARDPVIVTKASDGLSNLLSMRRTLPGRPFEPRCDTDLTQPALGALLDAERQRATGEGDQAAAWRAAARACEHGGLRWEQHLALWRLGAELVRQRVSPAESAEVLRDAHRYAVEQGARTLLHQVSETAASGRISLAEPLLPPQRTPRPAAFAGLTPREAEVLSYLVANRSNAEIATELYISAKTVSVHVSNLLRKTSTGSRREVAALALRLGWETREPTS